MNYQNELQFLLRFLKNLKINAFFYEPDMDITSIDFHLREFLSFQQEYVVLENFLTQQMQSHTIYKITDQFQCIYYMMKLPFKNESKPFVIGPYTHADIRESSLLAYIKKYSITSHAFQNIQESFCHIPILLNDFSVHTLIQTFGETVWNDRKNFQFQLLDNQPYEAPLLPHSQTSAQEEPSHIETQLIDAYLTQENELLQAVAQGKALQAEEILTKLSALLQMYETSDVLSNLQNYALALNTLLRKVAEAGIVNSSHTISVFLRFTHKINQCSSPDACSALLREIVRKYSLLIKNHSMNQYSILVQQTIKYINMDLTADLTLHSMAKRLNVNSSYLSTHFKKTTGTSYTEYVNHKRIDHSLLLLNTTSLQIQTIAQYCGISDLNYFTKLFKKYIHMSPTAYRKAMQEK